MRRVHSSLTPAISQRARSLLAIAASAVICVAAIGPAFGRLEPGAGFDPAAALALTPVSHLVVSEVVTGGASASDEFIELFNPSGGQLPLEGLEVVYVTASGATITRKASWAAGAPPVDAGAHLLIANEAGLYAPLADLTYANGMAATGGSVALRVVGASSGIDAVGWGTAASTWLEGQPAPAPPAGSSLERLPGGTAGSGQDTEDNLADFVVRAQPDPQNSAAPPTPVGSDSPSPSASASTTPTPTATPPATTPNPSQSPISTVTPTPTPTPSPTPASISIAEARALPDGTQVTVAGLALTGSDFVDGGGYLSDATAGVAVLMSDGGYVRGALLTVSGTIDDRYGQRTIRSTTDDIAANGTGTDPTPLVMETGAVAESVECQLVRISGLVTGSPTELSAGLAFDVDDGSGAVRVLVGSATGIDTSSWVPGASLIVIGVVGQRDSSGTGTGGYRVQPRDDLDVTVVAPSPSPSSTPDASGTPTASASPSPSPADPLVAIAQARAAKSGTHLRIRGVVTVGNGLVDPASAVVQDASAAILIRLDDETGTLARGELVELDGVRSTRSGMLTLRVEQQPLVLGHASEPDAAPVSTGSISEAYEAELVTVRGTLTSNPLRSTANNVSFTLSDGSGDLRVVFLARSGIDASRLHQGSSLEVRGVVGQETSGAQPARGYRIWPRSAADIQLLGGGAVPGEAAGTASRGASGPGGAAVIHGGTDPGDGTSDTVEDGPPPSLASAASASEEDSFVAAGRSSVAGDATTVSWLDANASRRPLSALVLVCLALLALVASVAWRTGALGRLRVAMQALRAGAPESGSPEPEGAAPDWHPETEPPPPGLSVVPLVRERD